MKYRVYRILESSYGKEEIEVEAENEEEAEEKVMAMPMTDEALSSIHWEVQDVERIQTTDGLIYCFHKGHSVTFG